MSESQFERVEQHEDDLDQEDNDNDYVSNSNNDPNNPDDAAAALRLAVPKELRSLGLTQASVSNLHTNTSLSYANNVELLKEQ